MLNDRLAVFEWQSACLMRVPQLPRPGALVGPSSVLSRLPIGAESLGVVAGSTVVPTAVTARETEETRVRDVLPDLDLSGWSG